jgi:CDP-4-dehydro-6-deoxyglucose reductase
MPYQVNIQSSGHVFEVEKDELILDAALRQGISFPYGCRSGACGTCLGDIVSGDISYPEGLPMALSENDEKQGKALFCQAVAQSDLVINVAEIAGVDDIEVKILPVRVISLRKLSSDVMEMQLKLPETERLQFLAGQYIDIILNDGRHRAFSLANSPSNDAYLELHIRHVPGGYFTDIVFNEMKEKALLRIEGPHGTFFIREDSERPKILIGGGTGFAPLKGMIEQMLEEGVKQPVFLYWGVRAKDDIYHKALAEKWAFQNENIHFIPVLSEPEESDNWEGRTGFVHQAVAEDFSDMSEYDVYLSGPPPMINAAREAFKENGLPDEQIFSDSFEFSDDAQQAIEASS